MCVFEFACESVCGFVRVRACDCVCLGVRLRKWLWVFERICVGECDLEKMCVCVCVSVFKL